MAQYDIYPNPGLKQVAIPFLVAVQNDHVSSRTGACLAMPLRANAQPVETMASLVDVPGRGVFVLSADEIFTIDVACLKHAVGALSLSDRAKIGPAIDKVIGDY